MLPYFVYMHKIIDYERVIEKGMDWEVVEKERKNEKVRIRATLGEPQRISWASRVLGPSLRLCSFFLVLSPVGVGPLWDRALNQPPPHLFPLGNTLPPP